jgi:hypothetical protein
MLFAAVEDYEERPEQESVKGPRVGLALAQSIESSPMEDQNDRQ